MGCCTKSMKVLLVVSNIIIAIIGLALLAGGSFVMINRDALIKKKTVDDIMQSIPDITSSLAFTDHNSTPDNLANDVLKIVTTVAIAFIVTGAFLFIVCIMGCAGACFHIKPCMIIYIVVLAIVAIAQISVVVLLQTGKLEDILSKEWKKNLVKKFVAVDDFTVDSVTWNVFMLYFECCCVNDYHDLDDPKAVWKRQREVEIPINDERWKKGNITLLTPVACCKMEGGFPNVKPLDKECATTMTKQNNNYDQGCFAKIMKKIDAYKLYILIGLGGVVFFQILLIVATIIIMRGGKHKD